MENEVSLLDVIKSDTNTYPDEQSP